MFARVSRKGTARLIVIGALFLLVLALSLLLGSYVLENDAAQNIVESFGYTGVAILSLISGLTPILPVPASTFTPVFEAAGLQTLWIIVALVIGVFVADTISFFFGHWSKGAVAIKFPGLFARFSSLAQKRKRVILPIMFLYASFMPLPNELIIIPLAIAGMRFKTMLAPLIIGNVVHQVVLVFGISAIFWWLV